MLRRLLQKLFRKDREPEDVVEEKWVSGFSSLKKRRFHEELSEDFEAFRRNGYFQLSLKKKNLFAWALHEPYRYHNVVVEMEISFGRHNGYGAAGLMFRYITAENYYYAIVSNRGMFRFDVVFNGNPRTLIPWLDVRLPEGSKPFTFRVIVHGSSFSFFLNGEWIAELDDEMFDVGHLAFCAQNYDESAPAEFILHRMMVESRPVEVEFLYYRHTRVSPIPPERRIRLAERLYGQGQFSVALIQLRRAFREQAPDAEGHFLLAETYLSLELYPEALKHIEACLELSPEHGEARIEKANLLYLQNRFLDAREYLKEVIGDFSGVPVVWNLLGNLEYALGNYGRSAEDYQKAIELQDGRAVFHLNAARAYTRAGMPAEAELNYAEAARLFFREEHYEELPEIFSALPDNSVVKAVKAKLLFQEGRMEEAEELFLSLIGDDTGESEIVFLEGLILVQREDHRGALDFFNRAIEKQSDFSLYWLKKAESEYHLGENPGGSLRKARELDPEDGWVHNLAGLIALEQELYDEALQEFEEAEKKLPHEEEVRINLSEVLARIGRREEAFARLETESGAVLNQRGNLYAKEHLLDDAVDCYRKAVQREPEQPVFRENLAAALWDLGLINEAEENLSRLLEANPSVRAFELIGQIAFEKGQYGRATVAWREGLEMSPDSERLRLLYARGLLHSGDMKQARLTAEELLNSSVGTEAREVVDRIRELTEVHYECALCGRDWWVPKEIAVIKQLRLIGDPPGEMPAGKCPSCGKMYCVGCVMNHMEGNRFMCPECGVALKLMDNGLKYLAMRYVE